MSTDKTPSPTPAAETGQQDAAAREAALLKQPAEPDEVGGPKGPEPTRYGDWTVKGRCVDF
ncbi:hypothetical protein JCM25156A_06640 [Komagataeibacter kakiaceti JCM 25156]|uniref:DUF1674 domain-containing protein n=1 Tax=Komagataeibacter TaxID=1434011 RepID=UPI00047007A9|nr:MULTISPECIES: DUF1674 domain-containing protein [Komagataeibacter]MCE2575096.1 DUF1674 domain-containing protein [Komagataeibacter sp. FNDCR2]